MLSSRGTVVGFSELTPQQPSRRPKHYAPRPETPMRCSADQVSLNIEGVVNGGVERNEALSGLGGCEDPHFALTSSNRLMRILRPVIGAQDLLMLTREANGPQHRPVGSEFVRDDYRPGQILAS